jgi:hypothetical protein
VIGHGPTAHTVLSTRDIVLATAALFTTFLLVLAAVMTS